MALSVSKSVVTREVQDQVNFNGLSFQTTGIATWNANGGGGNDTLSYAGSGGGVTIDLATNSASGGDAAGDHIGGFENVVGGTGNDRLTGDDAANHLDGGAGDNQLNGPAAPRTSGNSSLSLSISRMVSAGGRSSHAALPLLTNSNLPKSAS